MLRRRLIRGLAAALLALLFAATPIAQHGTTAGEWRTYAGDLASTRYAPLDQITADNFGKLEVAWRFKTENLGPMPEFDYQTTPLMVNGVLYTTAGTRRNVVALDAATGELLWKFHLNEGPRADMSPRRLSGRSVGYWSDGKGTEHIYYVTIGYQLVGLNAKTGTPLAGFGKYGIVDLKLENDQTLDPITGGDITLSDIGLNSGPLIAKDVIIVGAAHSGGSNPKSYSNVKGNVRAYDVRTGKRIWVFHTIPLPGEFGNDTWLKDSWARTGNTGMWAQPSVDEELGLAYLPLEAATGDWYGGHRPGNNLFAESLVAVDLQTGKRVWHYQFIHHGIWDWDLPCAPILVDIVVDGRPIKAIAQPSKQAWLYVLDRQTGKPVWPIEERPVPQTDVPGEWTSATQPFPTKPPAFDRQSPLKPEDLIDFTPELRAEAEKALTRYKNGPIFTPPVRRTEDGLIGTLMFPGSHGGANWPGGAVDPETKVFYIYSPTGGRVASLLPAEGERASMAYVQRSPTLTVRGLPIVKPPWGRLTAIDLNKGEILWQVPHGETPDTVKNHPALKGLTIPRTGSGEHAGTLVTKTLVIVGENAFSTTPNGARGAMLRAYNKTTGAEVGAVYMPAPQSGSPMTYMLKGRQYLVVAVSGGNYRGELLVYALPDVATRPTSGARE
jgi:quinoprotein glucose dehydrogenase